MKRPGAKQGHESPPTVGPHGSYPLSSSRPPLVGLPFWCDYPYPAQHLLRCTGVAAERGERPRIWQWHSRQLGKAASHCRSLPPPSPFPRRRPGAHSPVPLPRIALPTAMHRCRASCHPRAIHQIDPLPRYRHTTCPVSRWSRPSLRLPAARCTLLFTFFCALHCRCAQQAPGNVGSSQVCLCLTRPIALRAG
ncbi:hypothetical protein PVAP13_7NG128817 [Panicum virgatum]|uniref:Uncharacterized protein n=1 Tax=Panicum virgatum TaxID=38727 RepID=A0A8T0Q6N4_PANVG|nr:hypothetical protein PVAP13_7NG128817 [Panicum virgatum]